MLSRRIVDNRFLLLMGLPGLISFLLFKYAPMLGIIIAFKEYNLFLGLWASDWVGLTHFQRLFTDQAFFNILRNTLILSFLSLCLFPAPIVLALLLNEVRNNVYRRSVQTMIYLPHFISWVIVVSLTYLLLSVEQGLLNKLILYWGGETKSFMFDSGLFYPIVLLQELWRNIGWGSIIYMAAISGVDTALYESAKIDGAGKWKQIIHVTLPGIMPTVIILFILQIGTTLDLNFEHIWLMQNPTNTHISEVFETYVYKVGVRGADFSYSTALGVFKSIVGLLLVLGANHFANRRGHEGIW